jgi:hypothetical protein
MTHTDPLQELSDALSITPSPEFAARVRQHIAVKPVRGAVSPFHGLAAAAVLVLIASALVARWPQPAEHATTPRPTPMALPAPSPTPASSTSSMATPIAPMQTPVTRVAVTTAPEAPVTANAPFAETLVPDDQRLALARLLGSIRAGRGAVPDLVLDEVVDDEGRWAPRALVIEPLKVQPIK